MLITITASSSAIVYTKTLTFLLLLDSAHSQTRTTVEEGGSPRSLSLSRLSPSTTVSNRGKPLWHHLFAAFSWDKPRSTSVNSHPSTSANKGSGLFIFYPSDFFLWCGTVDKLAAYLCEWLSSSTGTCNILPRWSFSLDSFWLFLLPKTHVYKRGNTGVVFL